MTSAPVDIRFSLNDSEVFLRVAPTLSILELLRGPLDHTGTKYACGEGECGACTVLVDDVSVCACLMYAVDCDGRALRTVEGLSRTTPSAVQEAFVRAGAIQCGFCMPGMIVQASHLVEAGQATSRTALRRGLEGNLCRCTGYLAVFDAVADLVGLPQTEEDLAT
jgi:aerobic carbon-monoxide dehydrogenase small subunit